MRKTMFMLLAAALLVVTGCKKDNNGNNANGEKMTFSAGFDNGGAKTEINGLDMSWNEGDAVMINGKTFTADNGGASTTLSGDVVEKEGGLYKAYFPASIWDNGTLTLPATQTYNGTNLSSVNPMYAQSESTSLTFSNLCALVKIQLNDSDKTVTEIRVSADQPLSGEFEVAESGSNYKAVLKSKTDNAGVTLSCGTGVNLSENNVFYVALPEGTYTNLKFKVVAYDGMMATIETASASLTANNLHKLEREPEFKTPVSPSEVTVTADCVGCTYSVDGTVTVPEGSHTCEYGLVYCPTSAGHMPTVADSKIVVNTETFSGTKDFTADLGVLEVGVEYKVRAYAMIEDVVYSSESTVQTVTGDDGPQPLPTNWTNGKNPHPFSVANDKVVYFSQGNLQYNATGSLATAASGANVGGTWRFAEHQFDFIGADNANAAQTYGGWIDLFGWGTSGNNHGATCYQPWSTSTSYNQYYAYGNSEKHLYSSTGKADWGKANTISNGGSNSWRTLTKDEWTYLISRQDSEGELLYGQGKVGYCAPGLIILPDGWDWEGDVAGFGPNVVDESRQWKPGMTGWSNVYSYSEWAKMEAAGAVFLPAAGFREGTKFGVTLGPTGFYWSSSYRSNGYAFNLAFSHNYGSGHVNLDNYNSRYDGFSVRLVSEN